MLLTSYYIADEVNIIEKQYNISKSFYKMKKYMVFSIYFYYTWVGVIKVRLIPYFSPDGNFSRLISQKN